MHRIHRTFFILILKREPEIKSKFVEKCHIHFWIKRGAATKACNQNDAIYGWVDKNADSHIEWAIWLNHCWPIDRTGPGYIRNWINDQ